MKYIILLRGINISGKNKISMNELKLELLNNNYKEVITYLNSGNVILESNNDINYIREDINILIRRRFNLDIPIYVIRYDDLRDIYFNLPDFSNSKEFYNNIIFLLDNYDVKDIINDIGNYNDIDIIKEYKNIIYWSYDLKRYQKSIWWKKTASSNIKDKITIRNVNTIGKLVDLCEKER